MAAASLVQGTVLPATLDQGDVQHYHLDAAKVFGNIKAAYSSVLAVWQPHTEVLSGIILPAGSDFMYVEHRKSTRAEIALSVPTLMPPRFMVSSQRPRAL